MWRCKVINFLFKSVPIKRFQDYLVISHIQTCSACQSRLANREEAQSLLIPQAELQNGKDFWPNVRDAIGEKQSPLKPALVYRWRWAFIATLTIGSILVGIWFSFTPTLQKSPEPTQKFHVNYIEIENKPVQVFYFKTQEENMFFVWAEKSEEGG